MKTPRSLLSARFYLIIDIAMIAIYASAGILVFFWQTSTVPATSRKLFSVVLLLYSAYRGYSLYRKMTNVGNENKNQ